MVFHTPVLVDEVLKILNVQTGSVYIDATVGNGGHALKILQLGGIVYGLDQDPANLAAAANRLTSMGFSNNFHPVNSNFNQLSALVGRRIPLPVDGVLFDLGLSSNQIKTTGRGFSFNDPTSLDMRLDPLSQTLTAENIINTYSFDQLYDIFTKLAQESRSRPLITRIITERKLQPIKTGQRLGNIIRAYYTEKHFPTSLDPATKIFLALKIVVNNEIENLKTALNATLKLNPGCNVAVISFHSGEDRIVKQFIRRHFLKQSPKAVFPSAQEISQNPLSRSSVLRSYKII